MKVVDKEDKAIEHKRRKEKRIKQKMKLKRGREDDDDDDGDDDEVSEDDLSGSGREATMSRPNKKGKKYFNSDSDNEDGERGKGENNTAPITLAEQEELALKLLSSMQ